VAYQVVTAVPSAARTATGNGPGVLNADTGDTLALQLVVSAATGTTPTLDVAVQWSMDGGTTWSPGETADAFTQLTTTASKVKTFPVKAPSYRVVWTIGGTTPSFTFSVLGYMTT
jgi:hypothetical protein